MTSGYYRNAEATLAIRGEDGFLDTGDLAYIADGELYITGRLKDLIIRGGRNLVAAEIEEAASEVPGVRKGCLAAFGVNEPRSGTEQVVIVAETKAQTVEEREAIEQQVGAMEGVTDAHDVRIRSAGSSWFVDMHVTVDGDLSVRESHAMTERIEDLVRAILPGSDVTVHVEPQANAMD